MGTHTGPILEGKGDSDYERYVRVPELLELQKPVALLAHPEERLFQTTHQTAELWLHHIDYEVDRVAELIEGDHVDLGSLARLARIGKGIGEHIGPLRPVHVHARCGHARHVRGTHRQS